MNFFFLSSLSPRIFDSGFNQTVCRGVAVVQISVGGIYLYFHGRVEKLSVSDRSGIGRILSGMSNEE